jgi:hypothetical protein
LALLMITKMAVPEKLYKQEFIECQKNTFTVSLPLVLCKSF